MASEIKSVPGPGIQRSGKSSASRSSASRGGGRSAGAHSGGDQVTITDTAATLRMLEAKLAEMPIVDASRVEQVQESLADGSYEIKPDHVAEKLIEMERMLPDVNNDDDD